MCQNRCPSIWSLRPFSESRATLDAIYRLAQDSMDINNNTLILLQDMSGTVSVTGRDVAALKEAVEAVKVVLMEI